MKKVKIFIVAFLLVVSLVNGHRLRNIGYQKIPDTYILADERTNVWHGLSLRRNGIPVAWSSLKAYEEKVGGNIVGLKISVNGILPTTKTFWNFPRPVAGVEELDIGKGLEYIRFVQPYFDHPPFGAVVLSLLTPKNVVTFGDLTPYDMRSVSIWLGDLTLILIFILAVQITKKPVVGLLATYIYGTVPSLVLLSRYALLENVLVPLILFVLIIAFGVVSLRSNSLRLSKTLLVVAGVVTGLGALTKLSGWAILPVAILLFWKNRINRNDILKLYVLPAVVVGSLYFVWGLSLSPKTFINMVYYQGVERGFVGPLNLIVASLRVGIFRFPFDAWWIGGFVGMVYIFLKKGPIFLTIPVAFITLFNLIIAGANYPWYYIPLIPFMCISIAWMFHNFIYKINLIESILFFVLYFSSSYYWGYSVNFAIDPTSGFRHPFLLYRVLLVAFLVLGLTGEKGNQSQKVTYLRRVFVVGIIALMIFLNQKSLYFILTNWGNYPLLSTPGPLFVFN